MISILSVNIIHTTKGDVMPLTLHYLSYLFKALQTGCSHVLEPTHSETDKDEHTFCTFTENSYYKNKSRKTRCFTNHV